MCFPKGPFFGILLVKRCPPRGRFSMLRTDLDTPLLTGLSVVARPPSRFVRLTCSGILIISCTIFGFSQCYAQDVADAARQERARRENQQKKPKHVYTDEDLKRAQILTPEDRAEVEARKTQPPLPGAENSQDPLDAQALPADEPLGDVARRYRKQRESLRLQQSAQFHLPFIEETVHAAPKPSVLVATKPPVLAAPQPPVMPLRPVISIPAPPRVEPFQPPVKRSPFEHPRVFLSVPPRVAPSQPLANHVTPPQPPTVSATPARPSTIPVAPAKPAAPPPVVRLNPPSRIAPRMTPAQPAAPGVRTAPSQPSTLSVTPAKPAAPAPDFSVMPSPAPAVRVSPAQPAAPVVRPTPSKPMVLGVTPSQPAAPVIRVAPLQPTAPARTAPANRAKLNVITVQPGDSLWKLAQQNLGEGLRWHDLVAVNPAIVDPNHIVAGSHIFLPAIASRFRTATRIIVRKGDTLSDIARTYFGHASRWSCIAEANPAIRDANLIYESQVLLLPASCRP